MKWEQNFAARTGLLRRNTVREFLKLAGQPGIISLAGGLPDSALLPVEPMSAATRRALARFGSKALQYGPSEGVPELRTLIADRFAAQGVTSENILITSGSQQALDLLGRVLLDPGDIVAVQNPTYLAALSAWAPCGVRFQDAALSTGAKMAYAIPNFCNPSGETLDLVQRRAWVERCCGGSVPLVEDDAYGELRYEGQPLPSLFELGGAAHGPVIHVGTFSKVLAPGLRLGWIIAARELVAPLVQARQAADLHTSTFTQYIALQAIQDGVLEALLPRLREVYRQKRDTMLEALAREMPAGITWSRPRGGLFILLRLPPAIDGRAFAARALASGVLVVPGEEFHLEGGTETVRLNFSNPTLDEIASGISKLAQVARVGLGAQKMRSIEQ